MTYKRILLKISGEALVGNSKSIHDIEILLKIAKGVQEILSLGMEVCIVVGGGNIYRGNDAALLGFERVAADDIGMLGTVINALALQNIFEQNHIITRVQSVIPMANMCEQYIRRKARRHMEKSRIVIFAAGTGNPFVTTDTAAVLRAIEMNCCAVFKGTKVPGIFDSDPTKNKNAKQLMEVSFEEVITKNLRVMDIAAISLAKDNNIPILIFPLLKDNVFKETVMNPNKFSIIK